MTISKTILDEAQVNRILQSLESDSISGLL